MREITRYQCEHCDKHFATAKYTIKHEKNCWANPELKACRSCYYQERKYKEVEEGVVTADGHVCSIDAGDGHNERNCPEWRYCLDL